MSESTVSALITALQDNDWIVQGAAAKALGNQSTMSESTVSALITALQSNHSYVRVAAVEALGNQSTISESTVSALITALQDNERGVREAATEALGNQSTLSESAISQIVATADDRYIVMSLTSVLRTPRFFLSVKNFPENEIEMLYEHVIFDFSHDHHVSLFIHENKLKVFTEQGFEETGELSNEILFKIESTFLALQSSGGIEVQRNFS
ncbi:hypothetical protein BGZ76_004534 [Entomortierella beljakovae]|nr:hypothetical protein BGZ76_004534 [Entomortierella beljakovae]